MSLIAARGRIASMRMIRRALPGVTTIALTRNFHQSIKLLEKNKDPKNYFNDLQNMFKKFDKKKYGLEISSHIHDPRDAFAKNLITDPGIDVSSDPFDPAFAHRLQAVYSFCIEECRIQCELMKKHDQKYLNTNYHTLFKQMQETFRSQNPGLAPLKEEEILKCFQIFYVILNNFVYLDELRFSNGKVNRMLRLYSNLSPTANMDDFITDYATMFKFDPEAVRSWHKIFDTLESIPLSNKGIATNKLCPDSYELERFGEMLTNDIKNQFFKPPQDPFSELKPSSSDLKKSSSESKPPKKDSDSNVITFDLHPQKLFQFGALFGLTLYILYSMYSETDENEITFQEFTSKFLSQNLVSKVIIINNRTALIELNSNGKAQYSHHQGSFYFAIGSVETFERNLREVQDKYGVAPSMRVPVLYTTQGSLAKMIINFVPTLLFLGAIYYMTKKAGAGMGGMGGPMGFGKSTAKKFNQETEVKIRFKDVAGMSEAKQEVMEFVKFLQNPEKYEKLGAKIPRGAILSGPPGTGKTLIAKATAGEAGVPFYSVSGSEFVEMFVGVGASRVRDLFKTARENAPSIVFVDEIDAIGKLRSKGNMSGANDERETTLNQLLVEMDGFDTSDHVVVLAGTNRADMLDKALMRPGRFDRHIHIDNPELQGRKEIFEVHLKKIKLQKNIDHDLSGRLAALTPGFSGADIANVCNEAALIGARYNAESVTLRHFELAIERVIGGIEKKSKLLKPEEKKIVAYHEAGHAVCGWYLEFAHPLLKVSIIPRGQGALGYAQYLPPDEYLLNVKQLYHRMTMTLGGRVSEELNFNSVTSGAHDDFKKVTQIAQSMVLRFGMSEKVGLVNYADTRSQDDLTKPFSETTNKLIDEEVQRIVTECYTKCKEILQEKSKEVELVANELLTKESITREDMIRLLGRRPFPETNDAFDKYLANKPAFKNEQPDCEHKDDDVYTKET